MPVLDSLNMCRYSCPGNGIGSNWKRETLPFSASVDLVKWSVAAIINPRRACAARVTVLGLSVCLSVCLSVSRRLFWHEAAYELYKRVQIYKGLKNYQAILLKRLRLA